MTVALLISLFAIPAFAEETTAAATAAETTAAETTGAAQTLAGATDASGNTTDGDKKEGLSTKTIVSLVVAGVVVVAAVVLCIIFQEKVKKFLRVYKSEAKKIVWLPWDQTKKNTWVVLIVLVVCALAICLIDFGLSKGFLAFINLFNKG